MSLRSRVTALVAICAALPISLAGPGDAHAAELSPQCQNLDLASSQSIFQCVGTIRHRGGTLKFSRMDTSRCAEFVARLFREIGQPSRLRDKSQPAPSCEIVAEVSRMVTGKTPHWSACTNYPSPDPATHMRVCMQTFAPGYFGSGFETQIGTCAKFRHAYELALMSANNRLNQRVPENYAPPSCDSVNSIIAALAGGGVQWPDCMNYDPTRVREHLLACVATEPREFLHWRDCVAVRTVYEERLRATHGGLPGNYSLLSCADAQAVLDKAAAYTAEQEAKRVAQAEAAERARREAAERRRGRIEEARARILAAQSARRQSSATCDPGPNRYPDHEYGEVLSSLETACVPTLTPRAQLFLAGLGEGLTSQCGLPKNAEDRLAVAKFVAASIPVGIGGREYGNPDVGVMIRDQVASQAAYTAGVMTFRSLESCADERAIAYADGLVSYLDRTASQSPWVDGCELQYATLYSRDQCQCMADAIRGFDPAIHSKTYSRGSIKAMIDGNPLAATQMALRCGISDY